MISEGLSRLGEYEIQWPEVKRKIQGIGKELNCIVLSLAIMMPYS